MIRNAGIFPAAILLALTALRVYSQDSHPVWAASEPVWPWEPVGKLWEAFATLEKIPGAGPPWPKQYGEICAAVEKVRAHPDGLGDFLTAPLRAECLERTAAHPISLTLNVGAYPVAREYPLGRTFEIYESGWHSNRVDPEIAKTWEDMPSAVETELRYPVTPQSFLYFRMGLRRDLAAWHRDPGGLNLPQSLDEVDLNEPSLGYFHAETESFTLTLGRFPVHWSPSPDFGLALSNSVPFHNGAELGLKMGRVRYRFLLSSLNPWLQGTPRGDSANEDFPPGSEEYLQRHYGSEHGASIFHKRVYAENIKTLFAHRLEGLFGPFGAGLTETQIIGGKFPDFRDAGPFVIFHNDFKDGYTNSALSADATLRLPAGFSIAAELYMDDLEYAGTEAGNGNTASLLGYLAALRHSFTAHGWILTQSIHIIRTDPFLYGYLQPLNTAFSRRILASNYRPAGDSLLVDRYIVDSPIGYSRGGDAYDFWYRVDAWKGSRIRLSLAAACLAKGQVESSTPYEDYYTSPHDSPTGVVEREIRVGLEGDYHWSRALSTHAGFGWQSLRNQGHVRGDDADRFQVSTGVAWSLQSLAFRKD